MFGVSAHVRFVVDADAVQQLRGDPAIVAYVRRGAEGMAEQIREATPQHSGGGAASVGVHPAPRAVGAFDAGWDKAHYDLGFPESGTKFQAAQGFAWRVLQHYIHT